MIVFSMVMENYTRVYRITQKDQTKHLGLIRKLQVKLTSRSGSKQPEKPAMLC
jgi:hypothetical protein